MTIVNCDLTNIEFNIKPSCILLYKHTFFNKDCFLYWRKFNPTKHFSWYELRKIKQLSNYKYRGVINV